MGINRQRLRIKTGCFTCRSRRKKCDEESPTCKRCALSGRVCQWPTPAELLDRRHASHTRRRHSPRTYPWVSSEEDAPRLKCAAPTSMSLGRISFKSETAAYQLLSDDLEVVLFQHFVRDYYGLLLLPNCHPDFYHGWINEMQDLMEGENGLRYSVLANAASHMHFVKRSPKMQELALTYYSRALNGLGDLLVKSSSLDNYNGLLMSLMLLYLHGCMGRGTYNDIPRHLSAAMRILQMRLFRAPLVFKRPFDRLALESVLYQIFYVSTGLWSDEYRLDFDFDIHFWLGAEKLLDQSMLFPDQAYSLNSPVLGIPASLFRIAIELKQLDSRTPAWKDTFDRLQGEVKTWEAVVLCKKEIKISTEENYYRDARYLYILINSMLIEQTSSSTTVQAGPPSMAPEESWQMIKATQILRKYKNDEEWARCFIGNWPVYSLGYFVSTAEDAALVTSDLQTRWNSTKFMQIARYRYDLNNILSKRGLATLPEEQKPSSPRFGTLSLLTDGPPVPLSTFTAK